MKKVLVSVFALAALAGCSGYYDYYKGGVRYTQDGEDCIYYAGEYGHNYSRDIHGLDANKKVVYRNTRCADLFERDNAGVIPQPGRKVLTAGAQVAPAATCPCQTCNQPVLKRRYYIVPTTI